MSGRTETIVNKSNSSHTISESSPRVAGLTIQTASFGLTIPIIYGRARVAANLVWIGNFLTQTYSETTVTSSTPEQVTTTRSGKFGRKTTTITPASQTTQTTVTYVYFASPIFGLGEGPIAGLNAMWRDKTKLGATGWGEFFTRDGSLGQPSLGFMGDQDINYSGLALAYANNTELTSNGGLPSFSFEVNGKLQGTGDGVNANPADIIIDLATNPAYGAGFVASPYADMTGYRNYCRAMGLFISPCYDTQQPLAQMVQEICAASNSAIFSSQGLLKIIPYADAPVSGNGATYTPVTTPIYDLDDNDFLDFVKCDRRTPADCFNSVRVEYLDAAQDYAIAIAEAFDQAHIEANGARPMEPVKSHGITNPALARKVAQILLQRQLYVVNEYTFPLPWNYALLEPMDLLTLTDEGLGFDKLPVRITGVEEDAEGSLSITAEDYPFGIASVSIYPDHPGLAISVDYNASPGNVLAPHFFEPPIEFTTETLLDVRAAVTGSDPVWGGCQVWFSLDGDEYRQLGTINGGSIYGYLTAPLAAASGNASVALVGRGGQLLNIPAQDVQNLASLCWVQGVDGNDGGEFFAYETATLTGVNAYTLGGLVRGAYSSNQLAKSVGAKFARLDANIASSGKLQRSIIGQPTYWKFTSFNKYGGGQQSLVDAVEYTYTVTGNMAKLPPPDVLGFDIDGYTLSWQGVAVHDLAGYVVRFNYGNNINWDVATPLNAGVITESPFVVVGLPSGQVTILIKAVDQFGNFSRLPGIIITNFSVQAITNEVFRKDFHTAFVGQRNGCSVVADKLVANEVGSYFGSDLQAHFGADTAQHFATSNHQQMQYVTDAVLIQNALPLSMMYLPLTYAGVDLMVEYRKASPGTYFGVDGDSHFGADAASHFADPGPWLPWPGVLPASNDAFQFRLTLGAGATQGVIETVSLVVDAPSIRESVADLVLAIGGTVIPHTKPFTRIVNVQATLQAGGSGARTIETDKGSNLLPVAKALNSAGVAVAGASADFILEGY